MAAIGAGFRPDPASGVTGVLDEEDGAYVTVCTHPDGRVITLETREGDGSQRGDLVHAGYRGPWGFDKEHWGDSTPEGGRETLEQFEPDRESPYCGGRPITQARQLDGRERDILCRILRDITNACRDPDRQALLLRVIHLEQAEAPRLMEIRTVLEPRHD